MKNILKAIFGVRSDEIQPLNGLRAIAILMVILMHMQKVTSELGVFKNSYRPLDILFYNFDSGVDLFFILSGFLISGGLYRYYRSGRPGFFKSFYLKRSLRIFPAYYLFLGYAFILLLLQIKGVESGKINAPQDHKDLLYGLYSLYKFDALYLSNIFGGAHPHSWSLATEEQFYLLFPLLAYFFLFRLEYRQRVSALIGLYLLIFCLRFIAVAILGPEGMKSPWFLMATRVRFDSILVGVLIMELFYNGSDAWKNPSPSVRRSILLLGLVLSLGAHFGSSIMPDYVFRGMRHNLFTLGFGLVFYAALFPGTLTYKILGFRGFIPIARVSYGMYLWHLITPAFAIKPFKKLILGGQMNYALFFAIFAYMTFITFLVCAVLYALVEHPFLRWKDRLARKIG